MAAEASPVGKATAMLCASCFVLLNGVVASFLQAGVHESLEGLVFRSMDGRQEAGAAGELGTCPQVKSRLRLKSANPTKTSKAD